MPGLAERLTRFNAWIGRTVAWFTLFMVINTVAVILARDAFSFGRIWMQEITTWLHASVFLLGIAYTLGRDEHVRVDIFYRRFGERGRAWVDLLGTLLLLLPVAGFIFFESWEYVFGSRGTWAVMESSRQAGGLGYPAPPLLKTFMILMPVLLVLQGLAIVLRAAITLRTKP
ncbi:MAG: TRAP transporter small permease subunit [Pseudomonadota bacterium]